MKIQSIQFHDQTIQVLQHEGIPYVAMKSIVENIGLDWASQYRRIKNHAVLAQGVVMMTIPSKGGDQQFLSLPLGMLNGWLFGIDIKRVKKEIQPTLKLYQLECCDVLYNHFLPEVAAVHPNTIDTEQQHEIKSLVNEVSRKSGIHYQGIYTRLYEKFKIPRYQELPTRDYQEAVDFLSSLVQPVESGSEKRSRDLFNKGIIKAGINRYHELSRAQEVVLSELMDGLEMIDQGRKIVFEAGRKMRHIKGSSGIIYDAMAEPLMRMETDPTIRDEEVREKAEALAKPFRLGDWS